MDSDAELMFRSKYGDESAFEELLHRHYKSIYNLAYRYLGDTHSAEDLAQEVFLKVYGARRRYQVQAKFTTWLFRIAVNACLNYRRKLHSALTSTQASANPEFLQAPDPDSNSPGAVLEKEELCQKVHHALGKLPPNQRLALVLNKLQGSSYAEVAQVMNSSLPAVKSLLSRARNNLKGLLEPYLAE